MKNPAGSSHKEPPAGFFIAFNKKARGAAFISASIPELFLL
ncbi:hypothetical protein EAL2_c21050 [Peptoclostridium acidaminophilum DSM 3953]|uniref:Uncharacterized protein n=1 Tax=Peptoclostridium acidaminophilum DSM 3953 TaxID=1286171 RepID=W8U953_PEPAC|nr:hypothetical protein EAL2_c21050 [Peptoclostridium acidaminophilum DSM 3953]